MPLIDDGQEIDPFVSVPIAISTNPEATATADPELDPHGLYLLSKKWVVWPPILDQPLTEFSLLKFAHSERFAFPEIWKPESISLWTMKAFLLATLSLSANEPAEVIFPWISILSFMTMLILVSDFP